MKGPSTELPFAALDELSHVPVDEALEALAHVQRRRVLFALLEHGTQRYAPVGLADPEDDADLTVHRVEMTDVHLPSLAASGYIDWDRETHEVSRGPEFDAIEPLLELLADHGDELPDDWW